MYSMSVLVTRSDIKMYSMSVFVTRPDIKLQYIATLVAVSLVPLCVRLLCIDEILCELDLFPVAEEVGHCPQQAVPIHMGSALLHGKSYC